MSVKTDSIVLSSYNLQNQYVMRKPSAYQKNPTNQKYTGYLSNSAQIRIKKILYVWLIALAIKKFYEPSDFIRYKLYPSFVTLTLSQDQFTTDKEVKERMLKPFLQKLKRDIDYKYMFWRAEKQKTGRIHFHIIFDKYIYYKYIQETWNKIQYKNKYTCKYFKYNGNHYPPSTHIEKIDYVDDMIKYVLKYCSKNSDKQPVEGRQYSLSKGLEKLTYFTDDLDTQLDKDLTEYKRNNTFAEYTNDWCNSLYFKKFINPFKLPRTLQNRMKLYYLDVFNHLYNFKNYSVPIPYAIFTGFSNILPNLTPSIQSKLDLHFPLTHRL